MNKFFSSVILFSAIQVIPIFISIVVIIFSSESKFSEMLFTAIFIIIILPLIIVLIGDYIKHRKNLGQKNSDEQKLEAKSEFKTLVKTRALACLTGFFIVAGLLALFCGGLLSLLS